MPATALPTAATALILAVRIRMSFYLGIGLKGDLKHGLALLLKALGKVGAI